MQKIQLLYTFIGIGVNRDLIFGCVVFNNLGRLMIDLGMVLYCGGFWLENYEVLERYILLVGARICVFKLEGQKLVKSEGSGIFIWYIEYFFIFYFQLEVEI